MIEKKEHRLRRARPTRVRIALQKAARLTVNRTNLHIYASVISADGAKVLATASTAEPEVRDAAGRRQGQGRQRQRREDRRQAHCREGEGGRHREGGVRPRRLSIPRPRQGAGRCRA